MRLAAFLVFAGLTGLAVSCGKTDPGPPPFADDGPDVTADRNRLQGVWAIDTIETGKEIDQSVEAVDAVRLTFTPDLLTMREKGRSPPENYRFVLATAREPKLLRLILVGDDGEPTPRRDAKTKEAGLQPWEWLYKFDGDALVVAFRKGSDPRPHDFKAQSEAGGLAPVIVVRLKRLADADQPHTAPKDNRKN
jgi:uncharacterized protein (TIGR03067 family)